MTSLLTRAQPKALSPPTQAVTLQAHQHRPVSVGENESNKAGNRQGWKRGEDRKRKNLKMREDEAGSSCRKDEMISRFSNKPVLKHQKKFFSKKPKHDLQPVIKYKVHTARARQVVIPAPSPARQLCPPPHLLDSSPPTHAPTSATRQPDRNRVQPPRAEPSPAARTSSAAPSVPSLLAPPPSLRTPRRPPPDPTPPISFRASPKVASR